MKVNACPNCGRDRVWLLRAIGKDKNRFRIECPNCLFKSDSRRSPRKAARSWNKKAKELNKNDHR